MDEFIKLVRNRWKFGFFLFSKLPAAWLAGVRVKHLEPGKAEVTVPYKWLSQNPFRST
ncbi:MAG: thioesterase, partial [Sphingobacteriales bacterium 12-47-4]